MEKTQKLIIIGDSAFAEVAFQYFTYDSEYEVVAFGVEREFIKRESLFGIPVVEFETLESRFATDEHHFYCATVYTQGNKLRQRLYLAAKEKATNQLLTSVRGRLSGATAKSASIALFFEDNTVQPFVKIGNDVVLWSGNHVGHHSVIKDHCFISSHVVISGFCQIGERSFMGVNSTVANNINIGDDCVVGAAAIVVGDVEDGQTVVGLWKNVLRQQVKSEP